MKIAIAGASGFVGKALIKFLGSDPDIELVCLSRSDKSHLNTEKNIEWRKCDLFSMKDIENSLIGCDYTIYLVHSMLPSARLVQGRFQDLDLVIADNFARAAKKNEIKRILYLGGIIPDVEKLSPHLDSRLEVERTLSSSGIAVTSLRAGLIVGAGGSSFRIMRNLVERLPILICPGWTKTPTCPIYLDDVCRAFKYCIDHTDTKEKVIDLGGADTLSYRSMLEILSKRAGSKSIFMSVPYFSPVISRLWVRLITGAPKNLVYPLVESLKSEMLPQTERRLPIEMKSYSEMVDLTLSIEKMNEAPNAFSYTGQTNEDEVRSIQRIPTSQKTNAKAVADYYFNWLPRFLAPWIKVEVEKTKVSFKLWGLKSPLLVLRYSEERSTPKRQLFYVCDSLLARSGERGRLEFRDTIDDTSTIAAIHEFKPRLPWYIYKYTQAIAHLWVMNSFKKAVNNKFNRGE